MSLAHNPKYVALIAAKLQVGDCDGRDSNISKEDAHYYVGVAINLVKVAEEECEKERISG